MIHGIKRDPNYESFPSTIVNKALLIGTNIYEWILRGNDQVHMSLNVCFYVLFDSYESLNLVVTSPRENK